jgi:hypothetical protein
MKIAVLFVFMLTTGLFAQVAIPPGTILPVRLNSSLRSNKARPGQRISARIMQDLPLQNGSRIRAGAKVFGHVVAVTAATQTGRAQISLRFDTVKEGDRRLPVLTNLRALATMMDVEEAQIPEAGPDRGTSEDSWVTDQVGGDVVYHGASVVSGFTTVGRPVLGGGVLVNVSANPGFQCRGAISGNDRPQALWVFSSDACGVYGYPHVILAHAGRSDPVGEITLQANRGDLNIRSGSGLLLRVNHPR